MGSIRELKPNQQILKPDKRLLEACEQLRYVTEHPNERSDVIMQQGIYKQRDDDAMLCKKVDGVVIGYRIDRSSPLEIKPWETRIWFVQTPGYRIKDDLTEREFSAIKTAFFEAFVGEQQGPVLAVPVGYDTIYFGQAFMVAKPVERNPNVVSLVGGFQA